MNGIAVDGWCSGNPGKGGYRGIDLSSGKVIFEWQTDLTTNNLVEYLAVIHANMWMIKKNKKLKVYSDSQTAIAWFKKKKCKTTFDLERNLELKKRILISEHFLIKYNPELPEWWNTKLLGEIPADFGRK